MLIQRIMQISIIVVTLLTYFLLQKIHTDKLPDIIRLPALDALDDSLGRCIELNRPIHCSAGSDLLGGDLSLVAGLSVVSYVARYAAKYGADFFALCGNASVFPILQQTINEAFRIEGGKLKEEHVRFISDMPSAFEIGSMAVLVRENVGSNIIIGGLAMTGWNLPMLIAGNIVGAVNIGGSSGLASDLAVTCDYFMMADEIFAMGAYLSKNRLEVLSIRTRDLIKLGLIIVIITGVILASFNNNLLYNFLSI